MGKRKALTIYISCAVVVIMIAAILGEQLEHSHGKTLVGVILFALVAWTWGTFAPNSKIFGSVLGRGYCPRPLAAITFDDGPTAEFTPGVLDALRGGQRQGHVLLPGPPAARPPRDRPADRRRGPRAGQPRLRPFDHDVRHPQGGRPPAALDRGGGRGRAGPPRHAALSHPARISQPVRRAGGAPARLPRGGLDRQRVRHRQAGRRGDRRAVPQEPAPRRDPAAARRRRQRRKRRPVADRGRTTGHPRLRSRAGPGVRPGDRACRRAAPAAAALAEDRSSSWRR